MTTEELIEQMHTNTRDRLLAEALDRKLRYYRALSAEAAEMEAAAMRQALNEKWAAEGTPGVIFGSR